jgi:hypothetical protein
MPSTLRVDPSRLHEAAAAQSDVAAFVSGLATGQSMSRAATGMTGLLSGAACHFVGAAFDDVAATISEELNGHSSHLVRAADAYHQADEELGRRLKRLAE